jgi:hypothetical protein
MAQKKPIFDWSNLDRLSLINQMKKLESQIVGKELTIQEIYSLFQKNLKSYIPVRIRKYIDPKIEKGVVYIGGMYYSEWDRTKQKCIEVQFYFQSKDDTYFLDTRRFKRMCSHFADTVLHEIIHMRQFRRRNFKFLPDYASNAEKTEQRNEQSYLGSSDEIDAYGFNIACELTEKFKGDQTRIINYLAKNQKNRKQKFNSWTMYQKAFNYDHSHPIIKRLKKKVVRYLPHALIGKPYKNKDWINC